MGDFLKLFRRREQIGVQHMDIGEEYGVLNALESDLLREGSEGRAPRQKLVDFTGERLERCHAAPLHPEPSVMDARWPSRAGRGAEDDMGLPQLDQ